MYELSFLNTPKTMSSREIAELVESRHDNVRVTIERLVAKGVIVQPATQDEQSADSMGRLRVTSVYHLDKRSTLIVVAQLSPEFTARVVDRLQELVQEKESGYKLPKTMSEALRLALQQAEQLEAQQAALAAADTFRIER